MLAPVKKIIQKYKKMRSKKKPLPFNLLDVTDVKTVGYNNNTNLKDVASNKGAIIAAKEISDKYKNIRDRKIKIKLQPYHEMVKKVKYLMLETKARE